jgi:hypothetical protein
VENVGTFYGHLEYFIIVWYTFVVFWHNFVGFLYFPRFGMLRQEKSGNPSPQWSNFNFSFTLKDEHIQLLITTE